jgi:hypothetical protein
MAKMSSEEYERYLRNYELVMVDHHGVLRSGPAGYPLAVTQAQVKALISYLKELARSIGE